MCFRVVDSESGLHLLAKAYRMVIFIHYYQFAFFYAVNTKAKIEKYQYTYFHTNVTSMATYIAAKRVGR